MSIKQFDETRKIYEPSTNQEQLSRKFESRRESGSKIEKSTGGRERKSLFLGPCKNILAPTVGPRNKMSERGEHSREQEDCQNAMTMAMLIQLQEEFETLKKSNEEELSMLRAENA